MKRVLRIGKDVKAKRAKVRELMGLRMDELSVDARVELIKALIPLGLMQVQEELEREVTELAGRRYKRDGVPGHVRWARQWGSVYVGDQKLPVLYQRVRDLRRGREAGLSTYRRFQEPRGVDEGLLKRILFGLSCRRYEEASECVPYAFGLSPSMVSRRFIRASSRKLKELCERRLEGLDIVALIIDGKTFCEDEMIVALGITAEGRKVMLGFVQAAGENTVVCGEFLESLLERGLRIERGILCVMDGSKGLRGAVEEVFGGYALVQRCQWHKRENVLRYLPKGRQARFRKLLQRAYEEATYEGAKERLSQVREELSVINRSAVKSLDEGLEETLTLHRLGLFKELGRSLKTTNSIESVMSLIGQATDKVDYWKNSDQKQRWLATALLDIEPRLNRVCGYRHLPRLREALQRELNIEKEVAA
jgi:transposase-like protein